MAARRFAQVDVFGAGPLRGNPVAVVLDGDGLDDSEMLRVARWTNLAETTFLLPPEQGGDYRVRILTPTGELPFAGHPTLGSCHAWLVAAGDAAGGRDRFVQECGAGLVEVRRDAGGALSFGTPPLLRYEPATEAEIARCAAGLGIQRAAIRDAQWVDNGPGWVALLLGSVDEVLAITPGAIEDRIGVVALTGGDPAIEVRAFSPRPGAPAEDPATGSLNAGLARWLSDTGRLEAPYVARQGTALQRDGRIHVRVADGTTWIGGATETVLEGFAWLG